MSINIRYIIDESMVYYKDFVVWDQKEKRTVCVCEWKKDAWMIAGLLNKMDEVMKEINEMTNTNG